MKMAATLLVSYASSLAALQSRMWPQGSLFAYAFENVAERVALACWSFEFSYGHLKSSAFGPGALCQSTAHVRVELFEEVARKTNVRWGICRGDEATFRSKLVDRPSKIQACIFGHTLGAGRVYVHVVCKQREPALVIVAWLLLIRWLSCLYKRPPSYIKNFRVIRSSWIN